MKKLKKPDSLAMIHSYIFEILMNNVISSFQIFKVLDLPGRMNFYTAAGNHLVYGAQLLNSIFHLVKVLLVEICLYFSLQINITNKIVRSPSC